MAYKNKTIATESSVQDFLEGVAHPRRRADGLLLRALFSETTGWKPRMWGSSIVGYGQYHYTTGSGHEADFLATGFSPRKASLSVYIMPGYADFGPILARLGKHKIGKSCLYINKLDDVDTAVLAELILAGLDGLRSIHPVTPS